MCLALFYFSADRGQTPRLRNPAPPPPPPPPVTPPFRCSLLAATRSPSRSNCSCCWACSCSALSSRRPSARTATWSCTGADWFSGAADTSIYWQEYRHRVTHSACPPHTTATATPLHVSAGSRSSALLVVCSSFTLARTFSVQSVRRTRQIDTTPAAQGPADALYHS